MNDVRIRSAGPEDADAIARVFIASFGTLTFLPRLHTDDETVDFITNTVMAEQEVSVAEVGGAIAGFVATSHGDHLEHLYVHPDHQGRGIGSALLERAKARMPGGFRFWVFQENAPARRFYERHGCRVVELTDGSGNEEQTPDALYEWLPGEGAS
jgi:ribosomal protein S18 acetylase RimI-like enzyme